MSGFARLIERGRRPLVALVVGFVAALAVARVAVWLTDPLPGLVYGSLYLPLGPSEATQVATRATVLAAALATLTAVCLLTAWLAERPVGPGALATLVALQLVAAAGLLAASLVGVPALPLAVLGLLAVPLVLTNRFDLRSDAVSVFLGGTGGVALLLLLGIVLVPLAWGEGFLLVATELDPANVSENATAADFEAVPAVREDLFTTQCETGQTWADADRETCRFRFWHYEHERAAVRYLARHGVRCSYDTSAGESLLARYDGSYYRVTCGRTVD